MYGTNEDEKNTLLPKRRDDSHNVQLKPNRQQCPCYSQQLSFVATIFLTVAGLLGLLGRYFLIHKDSANSIVINQSINQSTNQPINQSTNQPINQIISSMIQVTSISVMYCLLNTQQVGGLKLISAPKRCGRVVDGMETSLRHIPKNVVPSLYRIREVLDGLFLETNSFLLKLEVLDV